MKGETILSFALAALVTTVHGAPLQGHHIEARRPFLEPIKDYEVFEAREAYVNTGKTFEVSERNSFFDKRANSTASATATVATTPADLPGCPPGARRRAAPLGCDPTKPQTGSPAASQGTGTNTVAKLRGFKASKNGTSTAGRASASGKAGKAGEAGKNKGTAALPSATAAAVANAVSASDSTTADDSEAGGADVKARFPTPTTEEKRASLDALAGGTSGDSAGGASDLLSSLTGDASGAAGTSTAGGASDLLSSLTGDASGSAGGSTAGGASDILSGLTGSLIK